jgi:hypothetical protein
MLPPSVTGHMCATLVQEAATPNARPPFDPVWLFPATYGVHLLEEYFVGGLPNLGSASAQDSVQQS